MNVLNMKARLAKCWRGWQRNLPFLRQSFSTLDDKIGKDIDTERTEERIVSKLDEMKTPQTATILDVENAQKYWLDIVKKHDYYAYIVGQHFPKSRQMYYYTVQAFFLEIMKSREVSRQPTICQRRIMFWGDVLSDSANNKKMVEPIGVALKELHTKTNANFHILNKIVSYQLFDIERGEMKTMNDLTIYAENTRSQTFYLFLHILGIDNKDAYSAASHLGKWYGIIDVLRKMLYYIIHHRWYVPSELLLKHNLFFDRIYNPRVEGIVADEFYDVILEVAAHAKKHLEVSRSFKDKLPQHAHRALLFGIDAEDYLNEIEKANFDIFIEDLRRISYVKIPYKILKAAKGGYF